MPTYEYACRKCKKRFTQFQSILAKPLTRCRLCGGRPIERLLGPGGGLLFKGSGFYITDYKRGGKAPSKPETEGAGSGKGKDSRKSDSPAAGKGEKKQ